ncbi:MAG: hypothetical protein AAF481_10005 [Acidobacteriota bacterium]
MSTVKEQVLERADSLPDDATWKQVEYQLYVRRQVELGEASIREYGTIPHEEVRRRIVIE